jgi:hypothetical protein
MNFNSRLLISELGAAAATVSAILIAGCATGERTGKFWDKGDIHSSDAYVANEMAKDKAMAEARSAPRLNAHVAQVGGTQDGGGHVSMPDLPDFPDAPPVAPSTRVAANSSTTSDVARRAQAAGAEVGSTEIASTASGGSIIAPYVQKRPPSGDFDNKRHDSEILKPKSVLAKQLDPFAATDAEPFAAPTPAAKRPTPPATVSISPMPAPPSATPGNAGLAKFGYGTAFAANDGAQTTVPAGEADMKQPAMELVPSERPKAPAAPSASQIPGRSVSALPRQSAAVLAGGTVQAPAASAAPKPTAIAPPAMALPAHPGSGIRLGDENLDDDEAGATGVEEKLIVESGSTHAAPAPDAHPNFAASPYESDTHHDANAGACVRPAPAATGRPAAVTPPRAPSQTEDTWESTKISRPSLPSVRQLAPEPTPQTVIDVIAPLAEPTSVRTPAPPVAAPLPASPPKPVVERETVPAGNVHVEHSSIGGSSGSDSMILDSASIHGRYTGNDGSLVAPPTPGPFDSAGQKARELTRPVGSTTSKPASTKKSGGLLEGKSASCWDDPFGSALKNTVLTADFSVPVLPDDAPSTHLTVASAPQLSATAAGGKPVRHPARSRAWFLFGTVAGLALSAVVWRRWRDYGAPPSDAVVD